MYGVIVEVKVDPSREEDMRTMLREMVVPRASARAGFVAGYWLRATDGDSIRVVEIYDSVDNARAAASQIAEGPPPGAPVTLEALATYEVLAKA
jgi:hypothetical protein